MARIARIKSVEHSYHVMARSIQETDLFQDGEDKDKYLELLAKYCHMYKSKILSYCCMDNHVHLLINTNGADISSIMQRLHTAYVLYFNRRHKRRGILFDGRFKMSDLYVGNLKWETTEEDLKTHFAPYGNVHSVKVIKD